MNVPATQPAVTISAMSPETIGKVAALETMLLATQEQFDIGTDHVIHASMYARTVRVPQGAVITGALVKVATMLVIQGDALVYTEGGARRVEGYAVLPAAAGRKQAFVALSDTFITMIFPTDARTVEAAEDQFTDDAERLASRQPGACNNVVITGE